MSVRTVFPRSLKTLPAFLGMFALHGAFSPGRVAADISSGTMALSDLLDLARQQNPEIRAARLRWEVARARVRQEASPDKPRLDMERMYAPRDQGVWSGAEEKSLAVSQELPFPATLYLRGRRARQEAGQAEAMYRAKELDVLARVRAAYARLCLSRHAIHIFEENVELMRRFARVAEAKYAAGKAPQADALKAQVELSKMLNELVTLRQEQETSQALLNTLLNRAPEAPLGVPADPHPKALAQDVKALEDLTLKSRPDLRAAALAVDRSRTSLALSRSEYLPDLMLQYRRRDMASGTDSHDALVGLSLPLWFWRQGAMVREARAERDMAEAEYQAARNMALFDVRDLLVKAQTARRMIELYHTSVLPQAEQALRVTEAAYRSDAMNFLELLDAARSLLNFRLEHYGHIAQYEQFVAELERAVGADLTVSDQEEKP